MKKTRIVFFSYPEYTGNSRYLYDYINANYKDCFDIFWYCNYNDNENIYIKNHLNFIRHDDEKATNIIENSNIIFDTHGIALKYDLSNVIYVNLWHGVGPKKAGFLVDENKISVDDLKYSNQMENNIDYFVTPSKFWNYIHGQLFNVNHHRMLDLGVPRNEVILKSKKEIRLVKKFKKTIFYLPTFMNNGNRKDDNSNSFENLLNLNKYNEQNFIEYLEKNDYLLIIRYHPSEKNLHNIPQHPNILNLDNDYLEKENAELYEILNIADVLITDYSSVYIDFMLLNKPIIFAHGNNEIYEKNRGFIFDDYDFWFSNNVVREIDDMIDVLNKFLTKNNTKTIIKQNKLFLGEDYLNKNKNASKKIFNYFFNEKYQLNNNITRNNKKILMKNTKILKEENTSLKNNNKILLNDLNTILNSKGWKILEKTRKYIRYFIKR